MKKSLLLLPALIIPFMQLAAKTYSVKSPDKAYQLTVKAGEGSTTYSVDYKGKTIINPSTIGILEADGHQIGNGAVTSTSKSSHRGTVDVVVGKNDKLADNFNQLTITYDNGDYMLTLRAYDQGVAFQWSLNYDRNITVANELLEADFGNRPVKVHFPMCEMKSWEEKDLNSLISSTKLTATLSELMWNTKASQPYPTLQSAQVRHSLRFPTETPALR